MDKPFAELVSRISPHVQGCPYPVIEHDVRVSAIQACEKTLAWRYTEPTFLLTPGIHEYKHRKPAGADVHVLLEATLNCHPLQAMTLEDALRRYPCWADFYSGLSPEDMWGSGSMFNSGQANTQQFNQNAAFEIPEEAFEQAGQPRVIAYLSPDRYIVLPLPDDDKPYEVRMFYALKPKRDADGMPSVIMDELEDMIFHRTLQHLLMMPNASWTSRNLAMYHGRQYDLRTAERRARANLGTGRANLSVRLVHWA